jgi:two-component system LytT family response regulator
MKAIIIDDELRARTLLRGMLEAYCKDVEVLGDYHDLPNGVKAIRKLKPDVVFLDIEMPGHSGLEIGDFFSEQELNFSIVFVTAYNTYAIQAIKLAAIDYLLKPIEVQELEDAVARIRKRNVAETSMQLQWMNAQYAGMAGKLAVPDANSIKFLNLADIMYFKADNTYTDIMMTDGSKLTVSRTLKNIEDSLAGNAQFFRCHKSYIINTKLMTDYVKSDGGYLLLKTGVHIPVSPDKVQDLLSQTTYVRR